MNKRQDHDDRFGQLDLLGLRHNPFPVAPDNANFYRSEVIEEIVAEIVHGICARKGFIILTGDVGLGKTTISRRIIGILESRDVTTSLVLHTSLQEVELLRAINHDFGIPSDGADEGIGAQMKRLYDFLLSQYAQGNNCAIIIDDAQNLDRSSLELVRMISNLEVDQQKLVQVLLVGQTELVTTLNNPDLRQLSSRIVIRKIVCSLSRDELRHYILFKLSAAGDQGRICISQPAFWRLYRLTRGNFRKVNLVMDRCLYAVCTHGHAHRITRSVVNIAASDLNPENHTPRKRVLALAATLMVPLMIAWGSWMAHLYTSRSSFAAMHASVNTFKVPPLTAPMLPHGRAPSGSPENQAPATAPQKRDHIDPAVTAFLGIYQLDGYADQFQQALKEGSVSLLAQRIYAQSGYQLIQLPTMAEDIRRRYGALAFTLRPDQPPTWLLFWRPRLTLKRFYYNYQGEEIYELQKLFSGIQLYRYNLDGIVGPRLMHAVITFQKRSSLPVTGFPDAATIFRLYHQQEANADA